MQEIMLARAGSKNLDQLEKKIAHLMHDFQRLNQFAKQLVKVEKDYEEQSKTSLRTLRGLFKSEQPRANEREKLMALIRSAYTQSDVPTPKRLKDLLESVKQLRDKVASNHAKQNTARSFKTQSLFET